MTTNQGKEKRSARIDHILEKLRLHIDDLHELAKQATERARETERAVRHTSPVAKRTVRKAGKKR